MLIRLYIILISVALMFNITLAQDYAQVLLKNIQDKFDSIMDLTASLTQSVNGQVNLKGKIYYKKDNHLRFELKNSVIISDGETAWNYNEKQNKVIITDYESEGNKILSIREIVYEYPDNCKLSTYETDGMKVLQLIPEDDTFSFKFIELIINDDYLITKALFDDPATGKIQVELTGYEINKNIPDNFFSFSPPEGTKVIDLR